MNNWCICWFFTNFLLGTLIFKGLTARRLYKSFGVKGLTYIRDIKLFLVHCPEIGEKEVSRTTY
jgi:hypothetical protein